MRLFFKADEDVVTQWQQGPTELIGPSRVDPMGSSFASQRRVRWLAT